MKNPFKNISKINPQREKGNRQLANDVYRALIRAPLTATEYKIALFIIDRTWGFYKSWDTISISQFVAMIGVSERQIQRALRTLIEKRVIHSETSTRVSRGSPFRSFLFNKHYDTWSMWDEIKIIFKCNHLPVDNLLKKPGRVTSEVEKGDIGGTKRVTSEVGHSSQKKDLQKKYNQNNTPAISHIKNIQTLILYRLNGIATKKDIIKVLSQVHKGQWWRVEQYLRKQYPSDGAQAYREALKEL